MEKGKKVRPREVEPKTVAQSVLNPVKSLGLISRGQGFPYPPVVIAGFRSVASIFFHFFLLAERESAPHFALSRWQPARAP
jgi:hypothetical protein